MTDLRTASPQPPTTRAAWRRTVLRWLVSFVGFPLGGLAAIVLTGPVDSLTAALGGGLVTGAVLGAAQAWALRDSGPRPAAWVIATAGGLMAGLVLGVSIVDYRTGLADLMVQGAVCGAVVGLAQAVVLLPRLGTVALGWPVALAGIWAAGWATSTSIGIDVGERFTTFGSSGALVVTLLTTALPVLLRRDARTDGTAS